MICVIFSHRLCVLFPHRQFLTEQAVKKAWKKIRTGEEGKGKTQVQKREKRKKNEIKTEINLKNDYLRILRSLARVLLFNYNS